MPLKQLTTPLESSSPQAADCRCGSRHQKEGSSVSGEREEIENKRGEDGAEREGMGGEEAGAFPRPGVMLIWSLMC